MPRLGGRPSQIGATDPVWAIGDEVKLGEPGCRESYYADGFKTRQNRRPLIVSRPMSCLLHCWNDVSVHLMHVVSANSLWQLDQLQGIAYGEVNSLPNGAPCCAGWDFPTNFQLPSRCSARIGIYQPSVLSSLIQMLWPLLNHLRSVSLLCWPNQIKKPVAAYLLWIFRCTWHPNC